MKLKLNVVPGLLALLPVTAFAQDLSGDWVISSSVGGATPITVYCTLQQDGDRLGGSCTPQMPDPQPSTLTGQITGDTAQWGYDVVFNGSPGTVSFTADRIQADEMSGTLSLSGTEAPFTALRQEGQQGGQR